MDREEDFIREVYGLKDKNLVLEAFTSKSSSIEHLKWWIDREDQVEAWRDILLKASTIHKNYIIFIIGDYGQGKSLSLFKILDEAKKYDNIYAINYSFKGEEKSKPGLDFIFRIFKTIDFLEIVSKKNTGDVENAINLIPNAFSETKELLKNIYLGKNIRPESSTWLLRDQTDGIEEISEIGKISLYFLRGEKTPNSADLKRMRVVRKIDNIDTAKEHLLGILCFLKNLGYSTFLSAIDEFEYLFSLVTKSNQSIYLALLRSLYDWPAGIPKRYNVNSNDFANLTFFISISESGWANLHEMERREVGGPTNPLLDRIDLKTILSDFDWNQSRDLIIKRLSYNRFKEKFEDKPLIPFTDDFVDYIYNKTEGVPRYITTYCGLVFDAGVAQKVAILTGKFAEEVLSTRGFQ